jgi:hypothetical protein
MGMVAHAYNSMYSEVGDQKDHGLKTNQTKSSQTPSEPIKSWCGVHVYHPSYKFGTNRRIAVQASGVINVRPYLKQTKLS